MEVRLLGPLVVETEAGPVDIGAAKERALLATLALSAGRAVSVEALLDHLWGDRPPATAVKTLQNYVARLRRVLPEGVVGSSAAGYVLHVERGQVDAHRFADEAAQGRDALAAGQPARAVRALETGLTRWRGEPVPDLAATPAGEIEIVRLTELRAGAEEDLAEARLASGLSGDVVAALETAARQEPLRERRWHLLMLALYRAGRQADALRAFQRARHELADGLGVEPGPALRDLERRILAHDPSLGAVDTPTAPPTRLGLAPIVSALAAAPMAGRDQELSALATAWADAVSGSTGVALITGEPGIGKSRLLAAIARLAHAEGGLALFGRFDEEPVAPFQPFVEMLRWYAAATPSGVRAASLGWEAAELARLVPDLGAPATETPYGGSGIEGPAARHRLFEAIAAFVGARARERPVLIALDDAQWADRATLLALRTLLRTLPSSRLLVVLTHRAVADGDAHLAEVAAAVPPEVTLVTVILGGLDLDAVRTLLEGAADERVADVHRLTAGSPLFVRELARDWEATGHLPESGELTAGLRQAVARRLRGLSRPARRLLQAGAVAGPGFELAVAATAAELDETTAVDASEEARRAGILDDDALERGSLAFGHAIVRDVVYDELTPERRRLLHRAVGGALEARPMASATPGAIAHHFVQAADGQPDPSAHRWSMMAGHHALGQLAWESAAAHFAHAVDALGAEAGMRRFDALLALARALQAAGMAGAAKARFLEAIDVARAASEPEAAADAALAWAEVPVDVRRELAEVIAVLRGAAGVLPVADTARRARLLGRLAFSLAWANDPEARATSDEAIAIAGRLDDDVTRAKVLGWAGPTRVPFEITEPDSPFAELPRLAAASGDPSLRTQVSAGAVVAAVQRSDRAAVEHALTRFRSEADALRLPDLSLRVDKLECDWQLVRGDVDGVEARANRLVAEAATSDMRNAMLFAGALLYDVRRWQGRLAELAPWFDHVHERGERVALVPAMRVETLVAAGRVDEARVELDWYVADRFAAVWPVEQPHSFSTLAGVAAALDHRDAADGLCARLEPWSGLVVYDGDGGILGAVDHYLGLLDLVLDRRARAVARLEAASRRHAALESPLLSAMTDRVLARATSTAGSRRG